MANSVATTFSKHTHTRCRSHAYTHADTGMHMCSNMYAIQTLEHALPMLVIEPVAVAVVKTATRCIHTGTHWHAHVQSDISHSNRPEVCCWFVKACDTSYR